MSTNVQLFLDWPSCQLVVFCRHGLDCLEIHHVDGIWESHRKRTTARSLLLGHKQHSLLSGEYLMLKANTKHDYAIRLRCPHGDEDAWVTLSGREETLEQILMMQWDFECVVHGVQRQLPVEGRTKGLLAPLSLGSSKTTETIPQTGRRSSRRLPLTIPVVAYGWAKNQGSFHEKTTTLLVNDSGGLLLLATSVEVGETFFLINKGTHLEQQCRVAYVQRGENGPGKVGIAFRRTLPTFWWAKQKEPRMKKSLKVSVRGVDPNGNPFMETAYTVNISRSGARLKGPGYVTRPGDLIELKCGWRKARFRIVWVGPQGPQADEVGVLCLEDKKNLWHLPGPTGKSG